MKKILFAAIGFFVSIGLTAQEELDYFGMPAASNSIINNSTRGFTGDNMPITDIQPVLSLPSPTSLPSGIAWDGTYLWVCGYMENRLFCVDPVNGDTIKTIPLQVTRPYGISYHDSSLYVLDTENKRIIELSYSGVVSNTVDLADFGNFIFPTGLMVSDNEMVFNDAKGASPANTGDSTYILKPQTLNGFAAYADFPSGIASDGTFLWVTDNVSQSTAKIDGNSFELIERFRAPGGAYPNGLAWGDNGLWYINNSSDSIYFVPHLSTQAGNISRNEKMYAYPNPAGSNLYFSNDCPERIIILDAFGRQVAERNGEPVLNLDGLNNGLYFVVAGTTIEKLIISR